MEQQRPGEGRYATWVFGPRAAEPGVSAFVFPAELRPQLTRLFRDNLTRPAANPLQMMVEAKEFDPVLVHLRLTSPAAGVAHFLRANFAGDRPALVGICLLLSGKDGAAEEQAVALVEQSRDSAGNALPVKPAVFQKVRSAPRPLLALFFFAEQALKDASLRILAGCLADAFFDAAGVPPAEVE
jgi:hypothetical protein